MMIIQGDNSMEYGEKLDFEDGKYFLDGFLQMPRKNQELFFTLWASDLYKENKFYSNVLDDFFNGGDFRYQYCQSPIEEIFIFAYDLLIASKPFPECEELQFEPQKEIYVGNKKYIADFYLEIKQEDEWIKTDGNIKLIVECDGHEFHEKTKEQVERRNQRDMDFKMAGYDVIHFSGSQLYKDAMGCANQVYTYIKTKTGEIVFKKS